MIAITRAPADLVVAMSDGIHIRFSGVLLEAVPRYVAGRAGEPGIHVHLSGVRGEESRARDIRYLQERDAWAGRRKTAGSESAGPPPTMPGVAIHERLTTRVTDDLGTEYTRAGGQVAGDGTEWDATWVITPAPPSKARKLRFDFSVDGVPTGKSCELDLQTD